MRRYRSFKYRGYTLFVDPTVIKKWSDNVSLAEKVAIWKSANAVYSRWFNELKAAESYPTRQALHLQLNLEILPTDSLPEIVRKLGGKSAKPAVLKLLRFARLRPFNRTPVRDLFFQAINHAAFDGDEMFFRRLGRVLEPAPLYSRPFRKATQIEDALVADWITLEEFCLCWCSDKALADLFKATKCYICSPDVVRKARSHLRLKKCKPSLVTLVRRSGNDIALA